MQIPVADNCATTDRNCHLSFWLILLFLEAFLLWKAAALKPMHIGKYSESLFFPLRKEVSQLEMQVGGYYNRLRLSYKVKIRDAVTIQGGEGGLLIIVCQKKNGNKTMLVYTTTVQ